MADYGERLEQVQQRLDAEKVRWNAQLRWDGNASMEQYARAQDGMRTVHALYQQTTDSAPVDERRSWLIEKLHLRRAAPAADIIPNPQCREGLRAG